MITRTLKSLLIALTLVLVVPTGTALAMQVSDGSAFSKQSSPPQVGPTSAELRALLLRSEALNQKYGLGQYKLPAVVVSEKTPVCSSRRRASQASSPRATAPSTGATPGSEPGSWPLGFSSGSAQLPAVRHRHHPLPH